MKKVNEGALSDQVVGDFKESMEHLKNTMARVDEKVLGDENAEMLSKALEDVRGAAASFKVSASNLEVATGKISDMATKLEPAIAKADKVMDSADQALSSIKTGADDFASVARSMRTGKGLLAALIHDPELKTEFSDLISNLKRRGFLFYRDSAGREVEEETPRSQSPGRQQLFRR